MAQNALSRISSHEEVCAERWKNIGFQLAAVSTQLGAMSKTALRIGFGTVGLLLVIVGYFIDRFGLPGH